MRSGIVPHAYNIDETNVHELDSMTLVFLAIDHAPSKKPIIAHLEDAGIAFVDVGMGVHAIDGHLTGVVRATASTPEERH